ncbi:MAG: c-type cytochrome [Hyphomicrobiales bacterium]
MLKSLKVFAAVSLALGFAASAADAGKYGLGRDARPEEIKAWDIDVRPDGQGLPEGKGSVAEGEEAFIEKCAACHGEFGEGIDRWPVLAGGQDSLASEDPVKTIGSYWPYLSTVYDYVYRAMPFGDAQSLTPDETYALVAYILNMNDIVEDDFVLSHENFASIKMPNEANFVDDPRPVNNMRSSGKLCMANCKPKVEIVMRARVLDVTPDEDKNPSASID